MPTQKKINVWDPSGGNYTAGPDPWSSTPKQVEPATKFFTPRTRTPAQHINWALAEYSRAIENLKEATARNEDWRYGTATLGATTDTGVGQMIWHPGHQAIIHLLDSNTFTSNPITMYWTRNLGHNWSTFTTFATPTGARGALGYGSGSRRFDILYFAYGNTIRRWDHATQSVVTTSPAGLSSAGGASFLHSPTNDKTYLLEANSPNSRLWSSADTDLVSWVVESTLATPSSVPKMVEQNGTVVIADAYGALRARNNTSDLFTTASLATTLGISNNFELAAICASQLDKKFYVLLADASGLEPDLAALATSSDGVSWSLVRTFPRFTSLNWKIAGNNNAISNLAESSTVPFLRQWSQGNNPNIMHCVGSTVYIFFSDGRDLRYMYSNDPSNPSGNWHVGGFRFISNTAGNVFHPSHSFLEIATLNNRIGVRFAGQTLAITDALGPSTNIFGSDV